MLKKRDLLIIVVLALIIFGLKTLIAFPATSKLEVWFQLNSENKPEKMTVVGVCIEDRAWLGRSLYTPISTDLFNEGNHEIVEVHKGVFVHTWDVDPSFYNGTYEVALWGNKIEKEDCSIPECQSCKEQGFHVDNMVLYKYGTVLCPNN